ncbi:ArnT family glycosyltransferase [Hymenobacter metallilatus]|uniref:Phospholipid carrier-dependent glycosyltransferase n=1 Tax=Hymenobacter metallilatus TaxID=2493666 RepID=A0A3R9N0D1_9BACT|nr:glycosyltransferase family 39 protein [Hymenobacter metallilatus]RSK35285.1 phospholipid carrier-dependent glycosyltransferase [Hymenobacter metallilatus]
MGWPRNWFWPLLIGLNFILHAPFFNRPPSSIHVWRQCNTLAVARNFYEEDMNILRPRVDRRHDTNGVTGMQFPSYEWLVAGSYKMFGFNEAWPRLINWLLYMAGVVAFYGLVREISGRSWLGAVGAWCMAWSPELFYHGINALPDILALSASVAGLYWFVRWRATRRPGLLVLSLLAITLAGLTKLQFLAVGFPIAVLVVQDVLKRRLAWQQLLQLAGFAVIAVAVPLAWYAYALRLIKTSGLDDFGIEFRPATDIATALRIIQKNLISDLPELLLGYGTLGLLLAGLWYLVRRAPVRHPWFWPLLVWSMGIGAYYFIELAQMRLHTYYLMPLLPLWLLLATWGAAQLEQLPRARPWLLALLLVQPVWAVIRIDWGRWLHHSPDVAPELFNPATRAELEAATPANTLSLVGPDNSGCIDFYYLHKKGFGFSRTDDLLTTMPSGQPYILHCITKGAHYLYTNDSTVLAHPALQPYFGKQLRQVGAFRVVELRRN